MVIGAIMHVIDSCRTAGAIASMFSDVQSRIRDAKCVDMTAPEYAARYIIARRKPRPARPARTERTERTERTPSAVVPIVHHARAAQLRALVEETKTRVRPVTPLDMCVTLYVLGHAYPDMVDETRGMYRPLAMYRVLSYFDRATGAARSRTETDWGQHGARLARLETLMRDAIAFAGDAEWSIDYRAPYPISPVGEFDLKSQHSVLFRFERDGVRYPVHLRCRFHSDPYSNGLEALVDALTNERRYNQDSACLVVSLDADAPFVVRAPQNPGPLLDFIRLTMRAHYARLNSEIARGIVKLNVPPYALRAVAKGATDPASLGLELDAAIDVYVDHIILRSATVSVTDVADQVGDETFESEPAARVFAPYTGASLSREQARVCGIIAPCLAFGTTPAFPYHHHYSPVEMDLMKSATGHAARAASAALDAFCVRPRCEVTMSVESGARTLRGRADAVDERGVVIEFKLHVNKTALRQLACYLAMATTSANGPNGPTNGPLGAVGSVGAVGYVVGLHDAVVHKVTVRDPRPIIAACFRFA
jgi:hypothetical protein